MPYHAKADTITYRSKMHPVLKRNFEVFSACDWLAALTAHIPNAGEHLVRYYGWYSNVNRGKRRKAQGGSPTTVEESIDISASAAKRAWARLIKQVYEVDPLVCPPVHGSHADLCLHRTARSGRPACAGHGRQGRSSGTLGCGPRRPTARPRGTRCRLLGNESSPRNPLTPLARMPHTPTGSPRLS
jgi:hypothetical protein